MLSGVVWDPMLLQEGPGNPEALSPCTSSCNGRGTHLVNLSGEKTHDTTSARVLQTRGGQWPSPGHLVCKHTNDHELQADITECSGRAKHRDPTCKDRSFHPHGALMRNHVWAHYCPLNGLQAASVPAQGAQAGRQRLSPPPQPGSPH